MKIINTLIIYSLISIAHAAEIEDCATPTDPLSTPAFKAITPSLSIISTRNCHKLDSFSHSMSEERQHSIGSFRRKLKNPNSIMPPLKTETCSDCKDSFAPSITDAERKQLVTDKEKAYIDILHQEMEKSISTTLLDIATLRNSAKTGSNYPQAIQACNANKFQNKIKSCSSPYKTYLESKSKNLSRKIGDEIAALISRKPFNGTGFLTRGKDANECNLSEKDILSRRSAAVEELITPKMIDEIGSLSLNLDLQSLEKNLQKITGNLSSEINMHPVLFALKANPSNFVRLFQSLKGAQGQNTLTANLRSKIYNSDNGQMLDSNLANRCTNAFNVLINNVCNDQFKAANLDLSPLSNYEKFLNEKPFEDFSEQFSSTEKIRSSNINLLMFCSEPTASKPLSLQANTKLLNDWMLESDKGRSLDEFSRKKISSHISIARDQLCNNILKKPPGCEDPLQKETVACRMYDQYSKTSPNKQNTDLADDSVNSLLRSFIGDASNVSEEAKNILIAEGVLPNPIGNLAGSSIPVSNPISTVANNEVSPMSSEGTGTEAQATPQTATAANTNQANIRPPSFIPPATTSQGTTSTETAVANQISEDSEDFDSDDQPSDMDRRRREIERRLGQSNPNPTNNNEATRTARSQTPRSRSQRLPASEGSNTSDEPTATSAQSPVSAFAAGSTRTVGAAPKAGLDKPNNSVEKRNEALGRMFGANSALPTGSEAQAPTATPVTNAATDSSGKQTIVISLTGTELNQKLEATLTQKIPKSIEGDFKIEIQLEGTSQTISYNVNKTSKGLVVILAQQSNQGKQYLERIQRFMNNFYRDTKVSRRHALSNLQENIKPTPSQM